MAKELNEIMNVKIFNTAPASRFSISISLQKIGIYTHANIHMREAGVGEVLLSLRDLGKLV